MDLASDFIFWVVIVHKQVLPYSFGKSHITILHGRE